MTEADGRESHGHLHGELEQVKNDLKTTRLSLEEVSRQKKSLENFRQVIAKMLGLDVLNLAVPDFEVISRLEKLIQTHHVQQATTVASPPILAPGAPHVMPTQPAPIN